jgi:hypothetical protein
MNIRAKAMLYTALIVLVPIIIFLLLLAAPKEIVIAAIVLVLAVFAYILYTIIHTHLDYNEHIKRMDKIL